MEDPSSAGAHCEKIAAGAYTIDACSLRLLTRKTNVGFLRPEHVEFVSRNCQPLGIKLVLSPESFLAKCSFCSGDVVTAVNRVSTAVATPEAGIAIANQIQDDIKKASRAEFVIMRGDEERHLHIEAQLEALEQSEPRCTFLPAGHCEAGPIAFCRMMSMLAFTDPRIDRIMPSFRNGQVVGIELFWLDPI